MGPGGNALLCLGRGCLKPPPLARTEVREALHFPSCRKRSVSAFHRETHSLLGEGCQDGTPVLTGPWHRRNQDLGSSRGMRELVHSTGCGEEQKQGRFLWLPLPRPWSQGSPLPLAWELLRLLLRLQHRLALLRTSDRAVTSDRKRWWADFSFFVFTGRTNSCPFSPLLTILLSSLTSERLVVVVSHCAETLCL